MDLRIAVLMMKLVEWVAQSVMAANVSVGSAPQSATAVQSRPLLLFLLLSRLPLTRPNSARQAARSLEAVLLN